VLYRPKDLSALSDVSGPVSSMTAGELTGVNVGYTFRTKDGSMPYRAAPVGVPTLAAALALIPAALPLFLDVKSPDADPASIVVAMRSALDAAGAVPRTTVYSTDKRYTDAARVAGLDVFEACEETRGDLARVLLDRNCPAMRPESWAGSNSAATSPSRRMSRSALHRPRPSWSGTGGSGVLPPRQRPQADADRRQLTPDHEEAKALGADAVLVNSPALFKEIAAHRSRASERDRSSHQRASDSVR